MTTPPLRLRRLLPAMTALGVFSLVTSCTWAVPADPGQNARLRSHASDASPVAESASAPGPAPVRALFGDATDDGARAVYLHRCGQCHEPFSPRHASADEWPGYVRKYGPRAGLFGEERDRVLRWLQANSR